ncbi:helix-turn-helix domain-containing protein [Flavobacterium paronense]|uniref:Helix-turn-helix domain-containing protein n=1 Tax=Flavobacterium paronense TaxID=1392775 RepID=A0ABV5GBB5_9FLAO|nr:helix-turn-helix domain-containing protein [Flavobacterium paronense]MDN3676890.1 helix-turn-helix domain-containing protein [Flavobacterium paronense]
MQQKYYFKIMGKLEELENRIESLINPRKEEVLLDSLEMQQLLKCTASKLQRLRDKGIIPCNKVGRGYYYPKEYFTLEFLNSIIKVEDSSKRFDD